MKRYQSLEELCKAFGYDPKDALSEDEVRAFWKKNIGPRCYGFRPGPYTSCDFSISEYIDLDNYTNPVVMVSFRGISGIKGKYFFKAKNPRGLY